MRDDDHSIVLFFLNVKARVDWGYFEYYKKCGMIHIDLETLVSFIDSCNNMKKHEWFNMSQYPKIINQNLRKYL